MNQEKTFKVLIVGGGSAGWMAANYLVKKWAKKNIQVSLLESPDIGTVGVGEGSTPSLKNFFDEETRNLNEVPGASAALERLSSRAQIVILSNVGEEYYEARKQCLEGHGMHYPLVANRGEKGPAVQKLAKEVKAPVFFLDDSPSNIQSVFEHADFVRCIHFVHDPRLSKLVEKAPNSCYRLDDWKTAEMAIGTELAELGY